MEKKNYFSRLGVQGLLLIIISFILQIGVYVISPDMVPSQLSNEGVFGEYRSKEYIFVLMSMIPAMIVLVGYIAYVFARFNYHMQLFFYPKRLNEVGLRITSYILGVETPKDENKIVIFARKTYIALVLSCLTLMLPITLIQVLFAKESPYTAIISILCTFAVIVSAIPMIRYYYRKVA